MDLCVFPNFVQLSYIFYFNLLIFIIKHLKIFNFKRGNGAVDFEMDMSDDRDDENSDEESLIRHYRAFSDVVSLLYANTSFFIFEANVL